MDRNFDSSFSMCQRCCFHSPVYLMLLSLFSVFLCHFVYQDTDCGKQKVVSLFLPYFSAFLLQHNSELTNAHVYTSIECHWWKRKKGKKMSCARLTLNNFTSIWNHLRNEKWETSSHKSKLANDIQQTTWVVIITDDWNYQITSFDSHK